jgi:hypothetical protein
MAIAIWERKYKCVRDNGQQKGRKRKIKEKRKEKIKISNGGVLSLNVY